MRKSFTFDHVVWGYEFAKRDGLNPVQLHLGTEEVADLLTDANFNQTTTSSTNVATNNGKIGVVAGIDVQQTPVKSLRVLTAQKEDEYAYYIL